MRKAYIDFVGAILGAGTFGLTDDELRAIGDFTREKCFRMDGVPRQS
jgi:hypothetical protein